ncbi:MAG: TonB-dependent receptor [Alphaproteobacteria bacterium]
MTTRFNRILFCGASGVSLLAMSLAASPAAAQTAPAEGERVDRVVISAERRDEDAQDVSISASVFTGADLTEKSVNSLADIQRIAPSIAINTFNRSTFINIRGVGIAQSAPTSSPGVAYYIDGVLIPHEQFIGQAFFDIASIEVLRGPQGTLTGQNSTGGAIYVRSPAPEFGKTSGYIDQTVGGDSWYKTTGAVNVPIGSMAALRASITRETRDSFTNNIGSSSSQPGNIDLTSARFNLEVRPTDGMVFNLRYENFDFQTDNNAVKRRNDIVSTDPFTIEEDARSFLNQSGYRLSGEAKIDIGSFATLRYVVSKQLGTTKDQTDGDRTNTALPRPLPPAANNTNTGRVSFARTEFDTVTHEVNLLSKDDGPFKWVVGAFYLDETVPVDLLRDNTHTTDFVDATVRGSIIRTSAKNTTKSGFGQVEWNFVKQLGVVVGARYSEDEQNYNRLVSPGGTGIGVQKSDETTGRVALNYRPVDDALLYVSASKGYKAGGVNLTATDPNFQPETNKVYEAGAKTQFFDGKLQVNGDFFHSDYEDIQLASLRNGLPTTQNAASGRANGAELEAEAVWNGWSFNGGVGWLDANFAKDTCINDTNSPPSVTDPGCPTGNRLVSKGRALPFSPKWTINAGIEYVWDLGNGRTLTPRLQYSRLSEQYATPFPSALTGVPGRDLLDLRITFKPNDKLTLEAFSTNVADRTYIASQIQNSSSADGGIIYGAPRQYGIRARLAFN